MFPSDVNFDKIKISTIDANSDEAVQQEAAAHSLGESLYFDFEKKQYVFSDGANVVCTPVEAAEQHTVLFINTLVSKYRVYDDVFGTNTDELVGYRLPRSIAVAEIKRQIEENLPKTCPSIKEIRDFTFSNDETGTFEFTEVLYDGSEVRISV